MRHVEAASPLPYRALYCCRGAARRDKTLGAFVARRRCRILYAARSETDHGPVENSEEGMAADAPVVEAELDVEALCRGEE